MSIKALLMSSFIMTSIAAASNSPDSDYRKAGNFIYLSGVPGGSTEIDDPQTEVKEVLDNLKAIAVAAGSNLSHIVKLQVYLQDMNQFSS